MCLISGLCVVKMSSTVGRRTVTLLLELLSYLDQWLLISQEAVLDPIVIPSTVSASRLLLSLLCVCKRMDSYHSVTEVEACSFDISSQNYTFIVTEAPRVKIRGPKPSFGF